jgi:protein SCO1/2
MIGLSGDIAATRDIATRYGIFFEKRATDNEGRYLVDHSASVLLIDVKGMLREVFPFGTTPEGFAADIEYFMK